MKDFILNHKKIIILISVLIIIFIVKVLIARSFNNVEWEPDSYMHFLELKTVYTNFPDNLGMGLNGWSKPLYIYVLGLIVQVFNSKNFFLIEVVSIIIFLLIAYLVYRIVYRLYGNFYIAITSLVLTSLSLTLFKSSISVLTEPIFTLTLVASFYFLISKRYLLASLFIGLCVLARIEGLFFIVLYFAYIIYELRPNIKRIFVNGIVCAIPFFIWNFVGFLVSGEVLYFKRFFQSYAAGDYGHGSLFSYPKMFITKEVILTILFFSSLIIFLKYFKEIRNKRLVIYSGVIFSSFVFVQAILWWKGSFGTAGLMRYFVSVIPFMIIFSSLLFLELKNQVGIKYLKVFLITIIFLQSILVTLYLNGILVSTKEFPKVDNSLIEAGDWIKNNVDVKTFVAADRPEILFYSKRDLNNSTIYFEDDFKNKKPGIYVWTEWSPKTNNIKLKDLDANAKFIKKFSSEVYVYQIK